MSDLQLLAGAARDAGALMLSLRGRVRVQGKADGSPVTEADLACDRLLRERLTAARPDYGWLSEETADDPARLGRRRVFLVDPLDGTTAFIRGQPWFCASLAVVEDGAPVVAAVYAPVADELYLAERGGGATLNGAPIRASEARMLAGARVTGDPDVLRPPAWPPFCVERVNALALRLALVAAGRFDAAVALGPKREWDLAAGALIATEAGAVVTDPAGDPLRFNTPEARTPGLVACAPALLPQILQRTLIARRPAARAPASPAPEPKPMAEQLLHLVFGGELKEVDGTEFRDLSKLDFVGAYPDYASARAAWKGRAQGTVDNALMRYFIIHAHRLLDPSKDGA